MDMPVSQTDNLENHARAKLLEKNIDLIAANLVGEEDTGIAADENALLLIDREGTMELPRQHKTKLARSLISTIATRYHDKNKTKDPRHAAR